MDSSSDSASLVDMSKDSSDARQLQQLNNQLRQMNDKLINEVTTLRAHFDQATGITSQLEKLHQQNTKLANNMRKVTSERDDLAHRLEINIQMLDELKATMESEKQETEQATQIEMKQLKTSFEEELTKKDAQLAKTRAEHKALLSKVFQLNNENQKLEEQINAILSAARFRYFVNFKTIQEVIAHMNTEADRIAQEKATADAAAAKETKEKLKKLKNRLSEERKARKQAESEVASLQEEVEQLKADLNKKLEETRRSAQELESEMKRSENTLKQQIVERDSTIASLSANEQKLLRNCQDLTKKLESLEEEHSKPSPEFLALRKESQEMKKTIDESKASIVSLRKQNATLVAQIKELDDRKHQLKDQIKGLVLDLDTAKAETLEVKKRANDAEVENNELKEQCEAITSQLKAAKTSYTQSRDAYKEANTKAKRLEQSLTSCESSMAKQKQEIADLMKDRATLTTMINKQANALQEMDRCYTELSDMCNQQIELEKQQQCTIARLTDEKKQLEKEIVPEASFYCQEFPQELGLAIREVAHAEETPTPTKLKKVLSLIASHYNAKCKLLESDAQEAEESMDNLWFIFDSFLKVIAAVTGDKTICIEKYMKDDNFSDMVQKSLLDMASRLSELEVENAKLQDHLQKIAEKVGASDFSSSCKALDELQTKLVKATKDVASIQQKDKKHRRAIHELKAAAEHETKNRIQVEEDLQMQILSLQSEKKELLNSLDDAKLEKEQLKIKNEQLYAEFCEKLDAKSQESDDLAKSLQAKLSANESEHRKQLEDKRREIVDLRKSNENLQGEIEQLSRAVELMKAARKEDKENFKNALLAKDESIRENDLKAEQRIAEAREQFEKVMARMREKNTEMRELVSNVSNALNESESRNKTLVRENCDLVAEKEELLAKIESNEQEQRRDKQLLESRIKAIELSETTQRQILREKLKAKAEESKRKIYASVANSFSQLFDPRNQLTDETFQRLLDTASCELRRYQKQDTSLRRILGITADESCEHAISQLLLSMYKQ